MPRFISLWNKWVKEEGIADSVYFVANLDDQTQRDKWIEAGFDAVTPSFMQRFRKRYMQHKGWLKFVERRIRALFNLPVRYSSKKINELILEKDYDSREDVIPFLFPQWDHTPRSGRMGDLVRDASPKNFQLQAERVLKLAASKKNNLVILKSWNEWGEGNFMEPDKTFGRGFIEALRSVVDKL